MKKFLSVIFTALSILVVLTNTSFAAEWGKGELKLEDWAVKYFMEYLRGKHLKAPGEFVIAKDSSYAMYTYCPAGPGNCRDAGMLNKITRMCDKKASSKCYQFARGRTVKWDNDINKGNKESKFNSKWSDSEVRAKLTELGFLGGTTSTTTKIEKKETDSETKIEKKETDSEIFYGTVYAKAEFKHTVEISPNKGCTIAKEEAINKALTKYPNVQGEIISTSKMDLKKSVTKSESGARIFSCEADIGLYVKYTKKEPKKKIAKVVEQEQEEIKVKTKKEKKTEEKVTSKTVSGERAIALHWEGYEDLIAGTIKFNENNNKGNIKLTLPNNDGSCEGSYSLQEGGKGTWQIVCTNDMGAAGTLKWGDSGTTGIGRDYKDKKVKFTVAKKS